MVNHPIPLIQISVEHMRYSMQQAFSEHLLNMDEMFKHAIEQACRPENVQKILEDAARQFLQESIYREVNDFFAYGPGREEVKQLVAKALTKIQKEL